MIHIKLLFLVVVVFESMVWIDGGKLQLDDDYDYNEEWDVEYTSSERPKVQVEEFHDQRQTGDVNVRVRLNDISVDGEMDPINPRDFDAFLMDLFGHTPISYLREKSINKNIK
jgi:hypothetical protein